MRLNNSNNLQNVIYGRFQTECTKLFRHTIALSSIVFHPFAGSVIVFDCYCIEFDGWACFLRVERVDTVISFSQPSNRHTNNYNPLKVRELCFGLSVL